MVDKLAKISLSHSTITLREDGVLEIVVNDNVEVGVDICKELSNAYEKLLGNKKTLLLHIVGNYVTMDKDAREYSASDIGLKYSIAEAFVINSLPQKMLANFYMRINKPAIPTKFFDNKKEAEEWLLQFA